MLVYSVRAQGFTVIGAGTILNPILKIVTTVAVLGAAYLFIVRPVLDTTEEVVRQGAAQFQQSQNEAAKRTNDIALSSAQSRAESYESSVQNTWPAAAREIRSCIRDARGNAKAMDRCAGFGQTVAHSLQSDYLFANSYADSLDAQGKTAAADQVRACVDRAGFKVGPMQRCADLADRLLFG
jgi:hypothetical protein